MARLLPHEQINARKAAATDAVNLVKPGMVVGLGTGDTASYAIQILAERRVPRIVSIPTSIRSEALAKKLGLSVVSFDEFPKHFPARPEPWIDITIDGADEIDPNLQLIKGKGGALLFEKIVAQNSRTLAIVADESKVVSVLGSTCPLPVEIVAFGAHQTLRRIKQYSPLATLRLQDEKPYVTDGGNLLIDLPIPPEYLNLPEQFHKHLKLLLGVIETGFFLQDATVAFVGSADGNVKRITRCS